MSLLHQGGVSDDVSLTAYITAALLELDAVSPSHACTQALDTSHISIQFSDTRVAHVVKSEHCVLASVRNAEGPPGVRVPAVSVIGRIGPAG